MVSATPVGRWAAQWPTTTTTIDIYTTNFGRNTMHRNEADGTFTDVADSAGVGDERFGVGCAFGDYDRDGLVDIFVANDAGPNFLNQVLTVTEPAP